MGSVERHLSQRRVIEHFEEFMRNSRRHDLDVAKVLANFRGRADRADAGIKDAESRLDAAGLLIGELRTERDRDASRLIRHAAILAHVFTICTDWRPWRRWRSRRELRRLFGRESAK